MLGQDTIKSYTMISAKHCIFETFQEKIYLGEDLDKKIIRMRQLALEFHSSFLFFLKKKLHKNCVVRGFTGTELPLH